ncbi:MAG TPA: V-type ATPase subunit [Candidatus Limnocylindria bacterium]
MNDYGNARIAARRSLLLDASALEQLAQSGSAAGLVSALERRPGWVAALRAARQVAREPAATVELAIERFRSAQLAELPTWYDGAAARLVEALVMDLDRERVVAIMRRRRAGQDAEAINPTITRGALLDGEALVELARLPNLAAMIADLGARGILLHDDARELARTAASLAPAQLESALGDAWAKAREERAAGRGPDASMVRRVLEEEAAERETVGLELGTGGAGVAALVERSARLARLDRLAHLARRDPTGIGPVVAYVAAVEAQSIRLRTVLARVAGGWSAEIARGYLSGIGS